MEGWFKNIFLRIEIPCFDSQCPYFMEAIEILGSFKKEFDVFLKKYFQEKAGQAGRVDILAEETVKMIEEYTVSGGKRIRPAFLYFAYLACGGKKDERIMKTSISMELLHSFLLIHDDIIDKDESRHGVPTLHEKFKKLGKKYRLRKDRDFCHFGNSMAMLAGDMAAAMACEIVFNSGFPDSAVIRSLDKLQNIVFTTVPGEMLDVVMQFRGSAEEEEILRMHEGKTARYTFEGPAHMGCLLAGSDENVLGSFSAYALPLGKAFQIRDDVLGVFGEEKKMGKPVGSDIVEGKQTLLVSRVMKDGNRKEKEAVKRCLGKKDLSEKELDLVRSAMKSSGSLDYSLKLCEQLVRESLLAADKLDFKNREAEIFFRGIAEYMIKRDF